MFSSQINSRDLFFSNPIDHFLGNNGGAKTSNESGFSSSNYSQNINSKELMSTNSQDLFSQSQKTPYGEAQGNNTHFQKYISQNLLFGKEKRDLEKYHYKRKDKEEKDLYNQKLLSPSLEPTSTEITEIKDLMICLNKSINKLNKDVSEIKDSMREIEKENVKQDAKISSFEEILSKQEKLMEEICGYQKKCSNRNDDSLIQKLTNESTKEVMERFDKLEDSLNGHKSKILESIKKFSTAQTAGNKKLLEDTKANNERILKRFDTKMEKNKNELETLLETMSTNYKEKANENIEGLKKFISTSVNSMRNPLQITPLKVNSIAHETNKRTQIFNKCQPIAKPAQDLKSSYNLRNQNSAFIQSRQMLSTQNSVHTPIAKTILHSDKPYESNFLETNQVRNNNKSFLQKQYSRNCVPFNVRRKTTPILETNRTPEYQKNIANTSFKMMKTSFTGRRTIYGNENLVNSSNQFNNLRAKQDDYAGSVQTSPYLTVIEAATLVDQYVASNNATYKYKRSQR